MGQIEWACTSCGSKNPPSRDACRRCGRLRASKYSPPSKAPAHRPILLDLAISALLVFAGASLMLRSYFMGSGPGLGTIVWRFGLALGVYAVWRLRHLRWWLLLITPLAFPG